MGLKAPIVSFGKHTAAGPESPEGPGDLGLTWITIDDPGNVNDTEGAGYGGVDYTFRIMKYAVRESNIDAYNADPANASLQITLTDRGDGKPATSVSWNEAARYVNWLNTREGFPVAYQFDTGGVNDNIALWDPGDPGYDVNNRYRSSIAEYFLPSEDEWYKAAYYNGSIYYDYPTGSDSAPTTTSGGTAPDTAVYRDGVNPNPPGPADVDQAGGLSPYGTMGQGGNAWEWNESAFDGTNSLGGAIRGARGGQHGLNSNALQSSSRIAVNPASDSTSIGFRVARKQPPGDNIEFVNIENAGNTNDDTGYGGVDYRYAISKYAIRESDIDAYNADPNNSANPITKDLRSINKPATNVSWNEAARFVNWLNVREGFSPAYKFTGDGGNIDITLWVSGDDGYDANNLYRNSHAEYFLPSEDEWYKAAYHKNNGVTGGVGNYWDYPTGSDSAPTTTSGGTATGTAVYRDGVNPNPPGPADVTQAGGLSPYGTMGQGGNTYDLIESAIVGTNDSTTEQRVIRGGNWVQDSGYLQSSFRTNLTPNVETNSIGFRVAKRLPQLEFVLIEDSGNADDIHGAGYGGVSYEYRITKYAIRETDIDAYNADSLNAGALQITLDERGDDKPATNVSWNQAARYVNWLNIKDGAQPAYKFLTGAVNDPISLWDSADAWQVDGENRYRHKDAKYFLPSEDEWYKAAYYNGQVNVYYDYPTGSDSAPVGTLGSITAGEAVYNDGIVSPTGPADVDNAGGLSPYGTMGQGGNTYEWMESASTAPNDSTTENRVLRGGFWNNNSNFLQSSNPNINNPVNGLLNSGFRVAAVPE